MFEIESFRFPTIVLIREPNHDLFFKRKRTFACIRQVIIMNFLLIRENILFKKIEWKNQIKADSLLLLAKSNKHKDTLNYILQLKKIIKEGKLTSETSLRIFKNLPAVQNCKISHIIKRDHFHNTLALTYSQKRCTTLAE